MYCYTCQKEYRIENYAPGWFARCPGCGSLTAIKCSKCQSDLQININRYPGADASQPEHYLSTCSCCNSVWDFGIVPQDPDLPMIPPTQAFAYWGNERTLFLGSYPIHISAPMDVFNFWRKYFRTYASYVTLCMHEEYTNRIHNLDDFFDYFQDMYIKYLDIVLEEALRVVTSMGVYDLSFENFFNQQIGDFCIVGEFFDVLTEEFNTTLQNNQMGRARKFDYMPTIFFGGGLSGVAAAIGTNVAMDKIAERSIRNANVTPRQKQELFSRFSTDALFFDVLADFSNVGLSLCWQLNQRGLPVWYPNVEDNQRNEALFSNISGNRVPFDRVPELLVDIMERNPYDVEYFHYISSHFQQNPDLEEMFNYFRYDGEFF